MAVTLPICWEKANVAKAISLKAKVDEKQTHYFLACHSPMKHIQDENSKRSISEEELYQKIVGSGQRDLQAVIYGDPGTGKSHLIHWLKLRCDSDQQSGARSDITPVLIERRSGSLKDALEQMLEQLGQQFEQHLDPVKKAIERISEGTARQLLANQLSVELGPGWTERGREPLPRDLRELAQACKAKGFGNWLCRDGGVVDRAISLLVSTKDIQDRTKTPEFNESDFRVPHQFRRQQENSAEVIDLILELEEFASLREQAAKYVNDAFSHAVVDMLGLSGANLRKIFDQIRRELQGQGKRLALFVEDVSAMANLDVEVVNALEPQDRHDICPLTAVLGMTRVGYENLRDNQKSRIEVLACLDHDTTRRWSQDQKGLAQFTARYLNAARLPESEVTAIAEHRRENGTDVNISRCTECTARKECHKRFGKVQIDGLDIGMYPLTLAAPFRMLDQIASDSSSNITPNQRGLLIRVVSPVLSDAESIRDHRFPNDSTLPIAVRDPLYWTELEQGYCGGWDESNRRRLLHLTQLWIEEPSSADEASVRLLPLLDPLGMPVFSKETTVADEKLAEEDLPPPPAGKSKADEAAERKVSQAVQHLRAWKDGESLRDDRHLRMLVANFIRRSIPWDCHQRPPVSEWDRLLKQSGDGSYRFVTIEGQISEPAIVGAKIEEFPRTEETREFLEALVRFEHLGKKTWNFAAGEHHKRIVERWLRKHSEAVISSLEPPLDVASPVASAIQFLCLVTILRTHSKLPQAAADLMGALFADNWQSTPTTLSNRLTELVEDMVGRFVEVRRFAIKELAVVQGRTGGLNFINPVTAVDTATAFHKVPQVQAVPEEYFEKFWKTRYFDGLEGGLRPYADLPAVLEAERAEIKAHLEQVTNTLSDAQYDTSDLRAAVVLFCQELEVLVETRKATRFVLPSPEFDDLYKTKRFSEHRQTWGVALDRARRTIESPDLYEILLFDATPLIQAVTDIGIAAEYVTLLHSQLTLQEDYVKEGGDPQELERQLLAALAGICDLTVSEGEAENDASE